MERSITRTQYSGSIDAGQFYRLVKDLTEDIPEENVEQPCAEEQDLNLGSPAEITASPTPQRRGVTPTSPRLLRLSNRPRSPREPLARDSGERKHSPRAGGSSEKVAALLGAGDEKKTRTSAPIASSARRIKNVTDLVKSSKLRNSGGDNKLDDLPVGVRVATYWRDEEISLTGQQRLVEAGLIEAVDKDPKSDEAATELGRHICLVRSGGYFKICAGRSSDMTSEKATVWATAIPMNVTNIKWQAKDLTKIELSQVLAKIKKAEITPSECHVFMLLGQRFYVPAVDSKYFFSLLYGSYPEAQVSLAPAADNPGLFAFSYNDSEKLQPLGSSAFLLAHDPQAHLISRWAAIKSKGSELLRGPPLTYFETLVDRVERQLHGMCQWTPSGAQTNEWLPNTLGKGTSLDPERIHRAIKQQTALEAGLDAFGAWPQIFVAIAQCADLIDQVEQMREETADPDLVIQAGQFEAVSKRLPADFVLENPPLPSAFIRHGAEVCAEIIKQRREVLVIEKGYRYFYLPFHEAMRLIEEVARGYNPGALSSGDLERMIIKEDDSLVLQLRRESADKVFHHNLTMGGIAVTACNEEWIDLAPDQHGWPKKVSLKGKDLKTIPTGYVKIEQLGKAPLYLQLADAEKIVQRITESKATGFSSADVLFSYDGFVTRVTATTEHGCKVLFRRSLKAAGIKIGSWIECGTDDIEEHIIRNLPSLELQRSSISSKPPKKKVPSLPDPSNTF